MAKSLTSSRTCSWSGPWASQPWARVSRGTDGDALYTSSTLALDPDTGRIVWYHQFIPGETMDMDESFEQILVDTLEYWRERVRADTA